MLDSLTVLLYIMCYAIATGVGLYLGVLITHSIVEFIEKKITKEKH